MVLQARRAKRRNAQCGPNRLPEASPRSAWLVFFGQFKSILILILIGATLLAALIGNLKDAVVILTVVVINAVVGFYQEYRAEQSLAALKGMLPVKTHVRREGEKHETAAEDLVPGDVVLLEAGDRVPADGRLFIAAGLEIDESALTGESQPVAKQIAALPNRDAPLGDRVNMTYMNAMLWGSLAGVAGLQAVAVHWLPAQAIFGIGGMTLSDWGIATGVASLVLILEEGRKLAMALLARLGSRAMPAESA